MKKQERKKMSPERAGEIALAIMQLKWRDRGFNLEASAAREWLESRVRRTNIPSKLLEEYAKQVIVPCALSRISGITVNTPSGKKLAADIIGSISLSLLFVDYSIDVARAKEKIDGLIRDGIEATRDELVDFFIDYYIMHFIMKVADATSVSIAWSDEPQTEVA